MHQDEMRTFGYICPKCGKPVMGTRSVFALEASNAVVECDCGASALKVEFDGIKYRIFVPCGICGETHVAVCQPKQIVSGNGIGLSCAKTNQFCCYIGPEGTVEVNLRKLDVVAAKEKQHEKDETPQAFLDNVIMYEILSELKDIAARPNGITCCCGSDQYSIDIRRSSVDIVCKDCGAKLRIPAVTAEDLEQLCCHMTLKIHAKK